ncbi:hypothetical protein Ciccas_011331, partial [Cichlidogyrus casuarinus]
MVRQLPFSHKPTSAGSPDDGADLHPPDDLEAVVGEAEMTERPFESLLDYIVAMSRKIADKGLLVILEAIKKSEKPPSVEYR